MIEQPENKIYSLIREMNLEGIRTEMDRILRTPGAGEKAIEKLPKDHPVRREFVRIREIEREREIREHKKIREQVRKAQEEQAQKAPKAQEGK